MGLCLPDEMGDLGDELEYLDLSGMGLDGWLPPSIGTLTRPEEIYFHDNSLCGPIPGVEKQTCFLGDNLDVFIIFLPAITQTPTAPHPQKKMNFNSVDEIYASWVNFGC